MDGKWVAKTTHVVVPPSLPPPQTQRGHNDNSNGRALEKSKQPRQIYDEKFAHHNCGHLGSYRQEHSMCNPTQDTKATRIRKEKPPVVLAATKQANGEDLTHKNNPKTNTNLQI